MDGTAVEDEASSVAAEVVGNTLTEGETVDFHRQTLGFEGKCRLGKADDLLQHLQQIGNLGETMPKFVLQALDGTGDALQEVSLALEPAPEAVGAQHLQQAEEDEVAQPCEERLLRHHKGSRCPLRRCREGLKRIQIDIDKPVALLVGEARTRLPEERGHIVVDRPLSPALEVDEPGYPVVYHHIARLEIAVHEGVGRGAEQHIGKTLEIVLKCSLKKIYSRSL